MSFRRTIPRYPGGHTIAREPVVNGLKDMLQKEQSLAQLRD